MRRHMVGRAACVTHVSERIPTEMHEMRFPLQYLISVRFVSSRSFFFVWLEAVLPPPHSANDAIALQRHVPIDCPHSATNSDMLSQNTVSLKASVTANIVSMKNARHCPTDLSTTEQKITL